MRNACTDLIATLTEDLGLPIAARKSMFVSSGKKAGRLLERYIQLPGAWQRTAQHLGVDFTAGNVYSGCATRQKRLRTAKTRVGILQTKLKRPQPRMLVWKTGILPQ